jgi:tetratricopeptide (TPR) repeat protein
MKISITKIVLAVVAFTTFTCNAQTMEERLIVAYRKLEASSTVSEMTTASSEFDQVTDKYPNELMSNYYSAYAKAQVSYAEEDSKTRDQILDQAEKYFQKVKAINPENDETYVLSALLTNARLQVDGPNRWKTRGEEFDKALAMAKKLNPDNPRIYYLTGISLFYKPEAFGGGGKKAKPFFEKAKALFTAQQNRSIVNPAWGQKQNEEYLKKCSDTEN